MLFPEHAANEEGTVGHQVFNQDGNHLDSYHV